MKLGTLVLRLVVGGFFVGHGLQKLRGSFGGPGLTGTEAMMEQLEMRPAKQNALAAALAETGGGAALVLGAGTPFAAAGLIATMTTAIRKVHVSNGPWNSNGGYEYNAVLIAAVTLLAGDGPGKLSLDALIGKKRWGTGWALFALIAGVVGSTVAIELGKRAPAAEAEPEYEIEPEPEPEASDDPATD
ncbi:DoxX family protein [Microbacteriaceae bacterium VKM Ac-2855]|nr:DoxX family protein [Microbacteriaceae bacterium VKM Ac-2855]